MKQRVEAVYERGVLRPLSPLPLAEAQRVSLTISELAAGPSRQDSNLVERARAEVASLDSVPTIEEVRSALASIPGSLSADVIAERGEF
jgi:predicted DNA-binding antitoxin AbrB/MazE fold protein